ncbi:ABC transporter permease [Falsiroseomonas oryzae]|uniref:ABC transporter permease n=1 Tax=Falsiroseomonas oryzae TaxID=2766473 RepID=UPI0022EB11EA|nr:ABC transporter permease [Roseomonas sp. MO-31]
MSATSWGERRAAAAPGEFARTVRGFRNQLRVVHALILREMQTRFGRNQLGFLWLFLEPLMLAGALATLKWAMSIGDSIPGVSIFVFTLVSYLPYFTFRAIISRAPGTLRSNMTLLYHQQIKLLDVVLARHALEMAAVITVMALIVIGVWVWGDTPPWNIPILFTGLVLLFLLAHGLGLMAAAAAASSEIAERLIHPLIYLSLPLSGALISLHTLDPSIREVLLWNPQAHIHEMVREGFFGDRLPSYFHIGYVTFWVAVVNLLGLAALRAVRPRLEF